MQNYLQDIEQIIYKNYLYLRTWDSEMIALKSIHPKLNTDATFINTSKNYVVIWLNSINEFLSEQIVYEYYKRYFEKIRRETWHSCYSEYEFLKIVQVIKQNHDGSYNWFKSILEKIIWSINVKNINGNINKWFRGGRSFEDFTSKLWAINELRNNLAHNSNSYFMNTTYSNNFIDDVPLLEKGFINLSSVFFSEMNIYYNLTL